ncbi:putative uncharacterized protein [Lachnospiraceae bacterium CAG:215]|nr:putative uncharacterized protein [Lachnospiraceae bacterium CAG:215]
MLDAMYEWMKNLAFYLVIVTAALEVLPREAYRKYGGAAEGGLQEICPFFCGDRADPFDPDAAFTGDREFGDFSNKISKS